MTQTTADLTRHPTRPAQKLERPRLTTMKIMPRISAALRLEAAIGQRSATDLMEQAILAVLRDNGLDPGESLQRDKSRPGRPGPSVEAVVQGIVALNDDRCVAIPTRISAHAAALLETLSNKLEQPMGLLAEIGVLKILATSEDRDVRALAGLETQVREEETLQRIRKDPQGFALSKKIAD